MIESKDSNRYLYPLVHNSIIHNSQKVDVTQIPIADEWISEICTNEYYSALKRTHAIAWMNSEDIMLSDINQSQKDKYCLIPPM